MSREIRFRIWDSKHESFCDEPFMALALDGSVRLGAQNSSEPDRYVISQYTGLQDKHGKPIYEGDILFHEDIRQWPKTVRTTTAQRIAKYPMKPLVVEWNETLVGYDPFVSEDDEGGPYFYSERIEVVGNIWEHGHLVPN